MLGVTLLGLHSIQGGVEILLVSSRYKNRAPALLGHFTSYLFLQFGANSIDNGNIYVYKDVPLNIGGRFAWVLNFFWHSVEWGVVNLNTSQIILHPHQIRRRREFPTASLGIQTVFYYQVGMGIKQRFKINRKKFGSSAINPLVLGNLQPSWNDSSTINVYLRTKFFLGMTRSKWSHHNPRSLQCFLQPEVVAKTN